MKLAILSLTLLGVFLAPVISNTIIENNQGNVGGSSHQSVNIDHKRQVVNVDTNNGWDSWNTVLDYQSGYIATRILAKKSCIVTKMNKQIMPDLATLPKAIKEKQKDHTKGPARKEISYIISPKRIADLSMYGKHVQSFCKGIPTYLASEVKKPSFFLFDGHCFNLNVLFLLDMNYCRQTSIY